MKKSSTLKNKMYEAIFSDIINGTYSSDVILTEKYLIEKYDCSRAPIREALTQLTTMGVVTSIPRHGYRINHPDRQQLMEIMKMRAALEVTFLEGFGDRISKTDVQDLRQICEEYIRCEKNDFMSHWQYNCQFHLKLFSLYGNKYAYRVLADAINRQTLFFVQQKVTAGMDLHMAVLDYLGKKEYSMAAKILRADIEQILYPALFSGESAAEDQWP